MLSQKGQLTDIGAWYLGEAAAVKGIVPKGDAAQTTTSAGWLLLIMAAAAFVAW